ncbi:unnamed protein product, partial [Allacma fusca]
MFFENISERLSVEIGSLRFLSRSEFCYTTLFKNCRQIQLLIIIFNSGYAPVVHLLKLLSMGVAILCGYLGIRHVSKF